MQANYAEEPDLWQFVPEANVGIHLKKKNNLWLDIGIMQSHLGFESAKSSDCWALSRSMAAENSSYFETGAQLGYTIKNEKWNFAVLALNGWQNITRKENFSLINWGRTVAIQTMPKNGIKLQLIYRDRFSGYYAANEIFSQHVCYTSFILELGIDSWNGCRA